MSETITLDKVLDLAVQLSPVDQVRLIEAITPQLKRQLREARLAPRKSLRGLWKGLDISGADLAEVRREMWRNFPL